MDTDTKTVEPGVKTPRTYPGRNGKGTLVASGRKKGVPNKVTQSIRQMIEQALDKAGGTQYLLAQSKENPVAFMGLVGKVLPVQLQQQHSGAINITIQTGIGRPEPITIENGEVVNDHTG
jgi:hypothetical protein